MTIGVRTTQRTDTCWRHGGYDIFNKKYCLVMFLLKEQVNRKQHTCVCANQPKGTWYAIGASWNRQEMARVCPRPTAWWNGWTKVPACSQAHGNRGREGGVSQDGTASSGLYTFHHLGRGLHWGKDTISSRMKSSCHTGVHCSFHTEKKDLFVNSFKQTDQCQVLNYHLKLIIKPSHPESSLDEVPWYQDIYVVWQLW